MITNFAPTTSHNLGGYRAFKFVLLSQIATFPMIFGGKTVAGITLKPNQVPYIGYATYETLLFSETAEENKQGIFYTQKLSGYLPGDSEAQVNLMEEMQRNYFIVIATDANGFMRLIGSPANPLSFKADFDSSATRSGARGYSFEFSALSPFRAPHYIP